MNGEWANSGDDAAIRRAFGRASTTYDAAAVLQREVNARLLERLDELKLQPAPRRVLDLGAGTGTGSRALCRRFGRASVVALDFALPMLQTLRHRRSFRDRIRRRPAPVCADAGALPFGEFSFDLVFSSLTLQWCADPVRAFGEMRRVLKPGVPVLFATLGPDTLWELRAAWAAVDSDAHVNRFLDMHDVGDALFYAGLADPVMDRETIVLRHDSVRSLVGELKALGANTVTGGRRAGLTGKRRFAVMERAYDDFRDDEGLYPVTFEVVYGLAWGAATRPGEAPVTFMKPGEAG